MPESLPNTETDRDLSLAPKKSPLLFIFSITALAGLILWALYLSLTKAAIINDQKQLTADIASLQKKISVLKEQKVEAAQVVREWIKQLEKDEIRWSGVISSMQKLVPVDALLQKPKIQFLSYSGNRGGKLTLSAQTREGSTDPFTDVAELLRVFNNSSFFKDAYVPSLTRGLSQAGNTILSFTFEVVYHEQPLTAEEITGKIPRK